MKELPIDIVEGSKPRRFRWKQVSNAYGGRRVVEYNCSLPASVDQAVADLVALAKQQQQEILSLKEELARRKNDEYEAQVGSGTQASSHSAQAGITADPEQVQLHPDGSRRAGKRRTARE